MMCGEWSDILSCLGHQRSPLIMVYHIDLYELFCEHLESRGTPLTVHIHMVVLDIIMTRSLGQYRKINLHLQKMIW